jgi:pimeloyl-ACP methyl ester carboxylesterase
MSLPSLVFVHGAWHGPEHWEPLATVLRKEGFSCFTPLLDFCGSEHPVDSIASSIRQIQQNLETETSAGRNVVVINHSFGGCVGCSSVKGFTKRDPSRLSDDSGYVVGIIQLCAFMSPLRQSLYDVVGTLVFHRHGPDGWEVIHHGDPRHLFYNDLSHEEAQHWKSFLRKQSTRALLDRENVYPGWADVPVWYLCCDQDNAIPIAGQEAGIMAARKAGATITTRYIESGHSPFLSKTEKTAQFILEALASF